MLIHIQDVALVAAHVLTGKGKHGFSDAHRGQLIVLTGMNLVLFKRQRNLPVLMISAGPMLATGDELAQAASSSGVAKLHFEDISE